MSLNIFKLIIGFWSSSDPHLEIQYEYLWLCANLRRRYKHGTFSWIFKDSPSLKHSVLPSRLKFGFRKDSQHKFKGYFVLRGYVEKWIKRRRQSL